MSHLSLQKSTTWAEQILTIGSDPSVDELLNKQQVLQKDTTAVVYKLSELQTLHKSDHFLADGKGDKLFIDWITQVEKIAKPNKCPEVQLSQAKTECIVHKLI